jgi:hypothetical protein
VTGIQSFLSRSIFNAGGFSLRHFNDWRWNTFFMGVSYDQFGDRIHVCQNPTFYIVRSRSRVLPIVKFAQLFTTFLLNLPEKAFI